MKRAAVSAGRVITATTTVASIVARVTVLWKRSLCPGRKTTMQEGQDTQVPLEDETDWSNFVADVMDLGQAGQWDAVWREDVVRFRRTCRETRTCVYCHSEYQAAFNMGDLLCTWTHKKSGQEYSTEHYSCRISRNVREHRQCSLRNFYVYLRLGYSAPPLARVAGASLRFEGEDETPSPDTSYLFLRCYLPMHDP